MIIIPDSALKLIHAYEGLTSGRINDPLVTGGPIEGRYYPYHGIADCSAKCKAKRHVEGLLTIGRGHVIKSGEDFSGGLTLKEVDELFINDIQPRAKRLIPLLGKYNENQFAAALSCFYNIEQPWIKGMSPGDAHRAGKYKECAQNMLKYNMSAGKHRLGLWRRRGSEALLYLTGEVFIAKDPINESKLFKKLDELGLRYTKPKF